MEFLVTLLGSWLLADFVAGFIHWYEDKMLLEKGKNKIVNQIIEDNQLHHNKPYAMLKLSPWENIKQSMIASSAIACVLFIFGAHTIFWLGFFLAGFGNLVHRWSHTNPRKLNRTIRLFQTVGLLASKEHHDLHHFKDRKIVAKEDAKIHYCVMTAYLNPILDKLKFWDLMERILK